MAGVLDGGVGAGRNRRVIFAQMSMDVADVLQFQKSHRLSQDSAIMCVLSLTYVYILSANLIGCRSKSTCSALFRRNSNSQ
jgi:hypothetical protein